MRFFFFVLSISLLGGIVHAKDSTLVNFRINDQFGREYTPDNFDGKNIILLGADRKGSPFTELWGPTLADSLRKRDKIDNVEFVGLATLTTVPGFLKGVIKGSFPKEKEDWVLLDWQGIFAHAYEFEPDRCNILVFDKDKKLLIHASVTTYDETTAIKILDVLTAHQ